MKMGNYKIVVFDVDATLLNDAHRINESTKKALRRLKQYGILLVIASGRAPGGVRRVVTETGLADGFDYLICFNGGLVLHDSRHEEVIAQHTLADNDLRRIAKDIQKFGLSPYAFSSYKDIVLERENIYADIEGEKNFISPHTVSFASLKSSSIFKIVIADADCKLLDQVQDDITTKLSRDYSIVRSEPHNLEILNTAANKGKALTLLAKKLAVPLSETIAFGDAENDLSMFNVAGLSIAMGNSNSYVQQRADIVTGTNNEDGIAQAVERILTTIK